MTDDGKEYEYIYDAFGRLRKVKNTSTQTLVSEYWYNGPLYDHVSPHHVAFRHDPLWRRGARRKREHRRSEGALRVQ